MISFGANFKVRGVFLLLASAAIAPALRASGVAPVPAFSCSGYLHEQGILPGNVHEHDFRSETAPPPRLSLLADSPNLLRQKQLINDRTITQALAQHGIDASYSYIPISLEGSGDFVTVVAHPDGNKISLFLGDVSGHGAKASHDALIVQDFMATAEFREFLGQHPDDPAAAVKFIHDYLIKLRKQVSRRAGARIRLYIKQAKSLRAEGKISEAEEAESLARIVAEYYEVDSGLPSQPIASYAIREAHRAHDVAVENAKAALADLKRSIGEYDRDEFGPHRRTVDEAKGVLETALADMKKAATKARDEEANDYLDLVHWIAFLDDVLHDSGVYSKVKGGEAYDKADIEARKHMQNIADDDAAQPDGPQEKFVGISHAIYDKNTHILHYAGSGAMPTLFIRKADGSLIRVQTQGIVAGVKGVDYVGTNFYLKDGLESGDALIFMTDGVFEVIRDGEKEIQWPNETMKRMFALPKSTVTPGAPGTQPTSNVVKITSDDPRHVDLPADPTAIRNILMSGVREQQEDDVTMVVIGIH